MGVARIPQLVKQTVADVQRLAKLEARLAAEQMKPRLRRKGRAVGMGIGAIVALRLALLFLLAAGAAALALVLPVWAALLVMAGGLLLMGGALGLLAARGLRAPADVVPEGAGDRIKQDIQWIRENSG